MFRGIHAINLDSKGRISIPTRYREQLKTDSENQLITTIDTEEKCLLLYPLDEWEKIEIKIKNLPSFNKATRRIQRLLIGHATDVEIDNHGRVLLPVPLRDHAELDKRIMLIGQGNKFEIWSEEKWQQNRDLWLEEERDKQENELPDDLKTISL